MILLSKKYFSVGLTGIVALENIRSGLRINEVCPTFVDTPMLQKALEKEPDVRRLLEKSMPLGRVATVEEVANTVHFLASPGASFITGQSLLVESGV